MNWNAIGWVNLLAGRQLRMSGSWRSSISRSYYAAFSIVVGRLEGRVRISRRMLTPRHEQLPFLVRKHMTELHPKDRRKLSTVLVRLYSARIRADYNRMQAPRNLDCLQCCSYASVVFKMLGVNNG